MAPTLKRWRVKEVWKVTSYAHVEANTREEAIMMLEEGEGDFDEQGPGVEWEYDSTIGEVEEVT